MTLARKTLVAALAAGALFISAAAVEAGLTNEANVTISSESKTGSPPLTVSGSVGTARASLISKAGGRQQIGCKIESNQKIATVRCSAQNSGGTTAACASSAAPMVQAATAIGSASHITFVTNAEGACTSLTVDNDSQWKPMVP